MTLGIYRKYDVRRTDGRDAPGEKHHGCYYFVLDVMHDQFAAAALRAYAEACKASHPELSRDVLRMAEVNDYETGRKVNDGYFPPECYQSLVRIELFNG